MSLTVHVVAHTHWDREWYQPAGRFRQRLVELVDELLDAPPAPGESFLLDGQAVVLEDYLAVRPERQAALGALLASGELEAGPWYVLADELIPSAEALIRNLLAGRATVAALGGTPPPVLYCPDAFGHPAVLPELACGFGLPVIVAWRGFGGRRWPHGDTFEWRAPSGASAVLVHLPRAGYEFGASLPVDAAAARARWDAMRKELAARSTTSLVLLPSGADHHARQCELHTAIRVLSDAAVRDVVRASSLEAFAIAVTERVKRAQLVRISGELRDSYGWAWTLQGTFGTRAAQKRRNALAERLLVRDAEPWAALARARTGKSFRAVARAAWTALLHAHPHDTLCGCSIDEVAAAMDVRIADAVAQGEGIRDDAIAALIGYAPDAARELPNAWQPAVVVRNRAPRPRRGLAELTLREFAAHVPVGLGSAAPQRIESHAERRQLPRIESVASVQVLDRAVVHDRLEAPRHYPDDDLVVATRVLAWVDDVPAYGVRALRQGGTVKRTEQTPPKVRVRGTEIENDVLRVSAAADRGGGQVLQCHITSRARDGLADGRHVGALLAWEDRVDAGDLYTAAPRGIASQPKVLGARVTARGPLRGELTLRWRFAPVVRRTHGAPTTAVVRVQVDAGAPFVRILVDGENAMRDHRLRFALQTGVEQPEVWADAAFGPVQRLPLVVPDEDRAVEAPPGTAPLHRYVSLFGRSCGATVFSDGLAEYEVGDDGTVFVTLVRAVGELSRPDLPERPGHAGWPSPVPAAQSLGPFQARFALMLHGGRSEETVAAIELAADDVLLPLNGSTWRSLLDVPPQTLGAELMGKGLAFQALKESEDGTWTVARCVNLLERPVHGAWRFGFPVHEARLARLDETPLEPAPVENDVVAFSAGPRAVVTVLVR